jgi:hypothetical protein
VSVGEGVGSGVGGGVAGAEVEIVTVDPPVIWVPTAGATLVTAALGSFAVASYAPTSPAEASVFSYCVPVWPAKAGTATSAAKTGIGVKREDRTSATWTTARTRVSTRPARAWRRVRTRAGP